MRIMSLYFLLLVFRLTASGQDSISHINLSLFIDDTFVQRGINHGYLVFANGASSGLDSAKFEYEAGDMTFKPAEYQKVLSHSKVATTIVKFHYEQYCPKWSERKYQLEWKGSLLNNRFIIIEIFNFDKRRNQRNFVQKNGYGFQVTSPDYLTKLRRKRDKPLCK